MIPRMDPRTQLKCDRGEWGYRYRLVRWGGGSGSFSVVRIVSRRFHRRAVHRHHDAEMLPMGNKTVSNRVHSFDHH